MEIVITRHKMPNWMFYGSKPILLIHTNYYFGHLFVVAVCGSLSSPVVWCARQDRNGKLFVFHVDLIHGAEISAASTGIETTWENLFSK